MGPIRQAACTSILMLSIILISKRKYYSHFFLTSFSLVIHQFSLIFNSLLFACYFPEFINKNLSKRFFLFIAILSIFAFIQSPSLIRRTIVYITLIGKLIEPAKSAILIWFINFVPAFIFILNIDRFNLKNELKKIFILFSLLEFILLPFVFINSLITYRLLLYIFPTSIYITSQIPDLNLLKLKSQYITNGIIFSAFVSLIVWLKFAYHSSCWLPYKNIIMN